MPTVKTIRAINFRYVPKEDRILVTINPGAAEGWSCWLTRRVVRSLLDSSTEFLVKTSDVLHRASKDVQGEIIAFEREAAMVATSRAITQTPADVLEQSARTAGLVEKITISRQSNRLRLELKGEQAEGAMGWIDRPALQRILQMLELEAAKAGWFAGSPPPNPAPAKPIQH